MSLGVITMLSTRTFAALLHITGLVTIRVLGDDINVMTSDATMWNPFLDEFGLRYSNGGAGVAEATVSRASVNAFKRTMDGEQDSGRPRIHMVRIGPYDPGEVTVASNQLRDGVPPPQFHKKRKLRVAQRRLYDTVHPHTESTLDEHPEHMNAVIEWLNMVELEEDVRAYGRTTEEPDCRPPQEPTKPQPVPKPLDVEKPDEPEVPPEPQPRVEVHSKGTQTRLNLYPPEHRNAGYRMLNSLNVDVMNREEGPRGLQARQNMEALLHDIVAYCENNNEQLNYNSWNGHQYHLLKVIEAKSDRDFIPKARRSGWIEDAISKCIKDASDEDGVRSLLDYLLRYHGDATRAELRQLGLIPKKMDEYEVAATMEIAKIGPTQWRGVTECLRKYLELSESFCVSEKAWRQLGEDHGEITYGTWPYYKHGKDSGKRPETVKWWTMDAADELERRLTALVLSLRTMYTR